ncbi:MAG TPA: SurA N-terminal domain-containing protein [Candidatus Omnitrophota bacterium]|nr:SurA N-terminal domain-containing protein [Candidatus Omnitrophota bacterium]HRY85192.1 SurA N-terminal domain-containing protein [Candidatus Omnitrophota bacterium]
MLKFLRKYTKLIIWVVVGSFILWGGYSVSALKKEGRFAGEIFGKTVSFQEYNQFYSATQLFMPTEKPLEDPEALRSYTWQNIIYAREAKREGVKISDEDVRNEIANLLKQQGLVNPTQEQYKIWLTRALHMSPRDFEEGLREFMRIQKLLRVKIASFTPVDADKVTDPKEKEKIIEKQKTDFMVWTADVNKRANLKDYLALPKPAEETTEGLEEEAPAPEPAPATSEKTPAEK